VSEKDAVKSIRDRTLSFISQSLQLYAQKSLDFIFEICFSDLVDMISVAFEKLNPKKLQKSQKLSKIQKPKKL